MKCKLVACLLSLAIVFVSCAQQDSKQGGAQEDALTVTSPIFKEAIQKGNVQVLDVRTAGEFGGGHIKNALQANWLDEKEFKDRTQYLDKNVPVYVYCQSGGRSASAQKYLMSQGYKVVNLEGGMSNWKMQNMPVEGGGTKTQMRVQDFEKVIASNQLVLVDVGAAWCPPCRKMLPIIEKIKTNPARPFYFLAVDGGDDIDVMKHIQSEGLPTFIVYKNGKEVWRKQGLVEEAIFSKVLQ